MPRGFEEIIDVPDGCPREFDTLEEGNEYARSIWPDGFVLEDKSKPIVFPCFLG